jgi:hypothetical protein
MKRILNSIRLCSAGMIGLLAVGMTAAPVAAQSPAPVGFWSTGSGNETLYVGGNGVCKFQAQGTLVVGKCSWNSSSGGGILTIMNTNQFKPAPIRENIVWVNRRTIKVWGDVFFLRY